MKDTTAEKIRRWTKIGTLITGGLASVLAPVWVMVQSARETAEGAQQGAESSYETLAPAITENQMDIQRGMDAVASLGEKVDTLNGLRESNTKAHEVMLQRLTRCETYIEIMSHGRYKPATEPIKPPPADPARAATETVEKIAEAFKPKPQDVAKKIIKKKKPPVPQSLQKAEDYQQQRKQMHCGKGDPLCGL
jgi:hypothetical protein